MSELDKNAKMVEFKIDFKFKLKPFYAILQGSDTYKQEPLDPKQPTKPCIFQTCIQHLRFPKQKQKKANIGIIKAYKQENSEFIDNDSSLSNPHNEIYTIDIEQEIQLRAFIYEKQTYYKVKDKYQKGEERKKKIDELKQGNIIKTIIADKHRFNDIAEEDIKWAFKVVNGSYKKGREDAFPSLGNKQIYTICNNNDKQESQQNNFKLKVIPKGYVEITNKQGDCIDLKLADLFDENLFNPNNKETLINKNIIFFAYVNTPTYHIYSKNGNNVLTDRVPSIELKILKTRFSLEFDGQTLQFLENKRVIREWNARSGVAIKNNKINDTEIKPKNRASVYFSQTDKNKSFYYDDPKNTQDFLPEIDNNESYFVTIPLDNAIYMPTSSTKASDLASYLSVDFFNLKITKRDDKNTVVDVAQIDNQQFKTAEKDNNNKNINLGYEYDDFIQTLLAHIKSKESINIPLNVKYQKRILILIERFKETNESTMGRMNIFIDGKRIDSNGNFIEKNIAQDNKEYEMFNPFSLPNDENNYAYILERNGPDSIGGELKLRIPEGGYGVVWHKVYKNGIEVKRHFQNNTLNLKNSFVHHNRHILIHDGFSPKMSDGCLLIKAKEVKDKDGNIVDNVLDKEYKSLTFHNYVQGELTKEILGKTTNNIKEFVEMYIEVRVRNKFEINKTNRQYDDLRDIEVMGQGNVDISAVTEYSKNI
ncbi:DUF5675 family protein, partial [Helicobacter sp. T3_23-1059]